MTYKCQRCGGTDVDKDPARGVAVCTGCGNVLEDVLIVSEVQFQENAGGGSSVIGQYVSSEGGMANTMGSGFHPGMGKESRAITLYKGKRRINDLAAQLKINSQFAETAYNFFKIAVARRLTRGRKAVHVIAACVYMVCRTEGTAHMLLDFSDVLQVNVYALGKTYLQLARLLSIQAPVIDPSILIPRFAHKLEFGDKENDVSTTATRLVAQMRRDWMAVGRRPSGLCGAALLVAARIHNFCRTKKDIIKVVKVCEHTLRKRLLEFEATPASCLTIDEFYTVELEEFADPPAFTQSRLKAKQSQLDKVNMTEVSTEICDISKEIDQALETRASKKSAALEQEAANMLVASEVIGDAGIDDPEVEAFLETQIIHDTFKDSKVVEGSDEGPVTLGPRPTAASLGITDYVAPVVEEAVDQGDGELDLRGLDDDELDQFIMTNQEVENKEKVWMSLNGEFLKEQEEKAKRKQEEEALKPEKKKKKYKKRVPINASTAGEAMEKMLQERKISSKINYDVLKHLNNTTVDTINSSKNKPSWPSTSGAGQVSSQVVTKHQAGSNKAKAQLSDSSAFLEPLSKISRPNNKSMESVVESVVESGPINFQDDDDVDDEQDEDDGPISALHLLGHGSNVDNDDYIESD